MKTPLLALCLPLLFAAAQAAPLPAEQQAAHVLNRIAFGAAPGDIERVTQMGVQRYIDQQLEPAGLAYPEELTARLARLEAPNRPAGEILGQQIEMQKEVRDEEEGARQRRRAGLTRISQDTADARLLRAVYSPRQLEEVLVDFWYNHFNVYSGKGNDRALVASYERDAIRPHVFGNFRELLGATAKHPAMLYYLDNYISTAPGEAKPGKKGTGGLNENYARELMELHTLGVDAGYTQKDVTELARMLTGWTYDQKNLIRDNQTFRFDAKRHDRGDKVWMGLQIPDRGQAEGEMALDLLAVHPSTARHLSTKLARYFVQDEPSPALVEQMAGTWRASHGDLRAVLRTLFASEDFMAQATVGAKFKTPYQYVISAARASATPVLNTAPLQDALNQLGMPLYGCQTPDGYKNTQAAWLNPDALTRRITFAASLASGRLPLASAPRPAAEAAPMMMAGAMAMEGAPPKPKPAPAAPPVPLSAPQLGATLGPMISERTTALVAASPEPMRATMLLGSPDFMQR